jgi:hypothetical protein
MRKWLRRIRGAVGIGMAWAAAHFGVGVIVGLVAYEFGADAFGSGLAWLAYNALVSGATGFLCGAAFSLVLGIVEGRRRFDQMSVPRFAGWGAVGGLLVASVLTTTIGWGTPSLLLNLGIMGLLGAGSAAGTLALARAADDQELLASGEKVAEIGLSEEEKLQLLGRT